MEEITWRGKRYALWHEGPFFPNMVRSRDLAQRIAALPLKESRYGFQGFAGCSPVVPDDLEAAFPHGRHEGCVLQEVFGVKDHLLHFPNLKSRAPCENFVGYFPEVIHVGAEEDRFFEEQGFQDIMTTHIYQASPHEDEASEAIEFRELPQGIQKDDDSPFPIPLCLELGFSFPWDFFPFKENLNLSYPFEISGGQYEDQIGVFGGEALKDLQHKFLLPPMGGARDEYRLSCMEAQGLKEGFLLLLSYFGRRLVEFDVSADGDLFGIGPHLYDPLSI